MATIMTGTAAAAAAAAAAEAPGPVDFVADDGCYVALTDQPLEVVGLLARVRCPQAGANVLFSGSTRNHVDGRPVASLCYAAYRPRALRSLKAIAADMRAAHGLLAVAVVHRLGAVPVGEDSILVAVSAPHRAAAWAGGAACLDAIKARVEIWKQEVFADVLRDDGTEKIEGKGEDEGERVWRANAEAVQTTRTTTLAAAGKDNVIVTPGETVTKTAA